MGGFPDRCDSRNRIVRNPYRMGGEAMKAADLVMTLACAGFPLLILAWLVLKKEGGRK